MCSIHGLSFLLKPCSLSLYSRKHTTGKGKCILTGIQARLDLFSQSTDLSLCCNSSCHMYSFLLFLSFLQFCFDLQGVCFITPHVVSQHAVNQIQAYVFYLSQSHHIRSASLKGRNVQCQLEEGENWSRLTGSSARRDRQ